jgi:hypothetical protein
MKKFAILIFALALLLQPLHAIDLSPAPSGVAWQEIPELKAAFLKPQGWFFKRESGKGTMAYFITKEEIKQSGQFSTGLTVNVFHLKKDSAIERGKTLIDNMAAQHHEKSWTGAKGPFQEFGCLLRDTDATGTIVMSALTVANPKTNTLYLFIFESPQSDWDTAWKLGKPIMDTLAIDDAV